MSAIIKILLLILSLPLLADVIVDTRTSGVYNGWSTSDGKEGGHVADAVNFSHSWLKLMNDTELRVFLADRGFKKREEYKLYGEKAPEVRKRFMRIGYRAEVIPIPDGPKVKLERFEKLVPADWLQNNLRKFRVFEVAWGAPKLFLTEHIPDAGYINTDLFEEPPLWNKKSDAELERNALALGIHADTPVVLYSRDTIGAARVALILMYLGVKDIRLLDGGLTAWKLYGGKTVAGTPKVFPPEKNFKIQVPARPDFIQSLEDAKKILKDEKNSVLVSIRSRREHLGEVSGYDDIKEKGDIPGAIWGHAGSDANHMEDFRNPDNTMISQNEILKLWQPVGIESSKRVSFYCGTGWRAAETFFYAYVMGWPKIGVYDGGWLEWTVRELKK